METLDGFLTWVASGPGAGLAAFYLVEHVAWFGKFTAAWKRVIVFAVTAVLGAATWCLLTALTEQPWPMEFRDWARALWSAGAVAIIASQLVHGGAVLGRHNP